MDFKTWNTALILSIALSLLGCGGTEEGPERAMVSGTVNLDSEPLQEGMIRFIPDGNTTGPQVTIPIKDGKFEIKKELGPVVGSHRIEIESTDDGGYAMDDEQAIKNLHDAGVKKIDVIKVPAKYNTRSTLKESVTATDRNQFHFHLLTRN